MADAIARIAQQLADQRSSSDPVAQASCEVLPYKARVHDALRALRALVTDDTPTARLDSDLRAVHGLVAALVGAAGADQRQDHRRSHRSHSPTVPSALGSAWRSI